MWSNPGETVLTPFMGVGSEVYSPVSMGRKAIGIELKESYFKQAVINLSLAEKRFYENHKQDNLL
jgi:tRNA G10  N-methylase Trm11